MKLPLDAPAATGRPPIALTSAIMTAILRTVEAGWAIALASPDLSASCGEVVITERLRDGMRKALDSDRFEWSGRMYVLPGTESRSRPDLPRPDGLTDIPVFLIEIALRFKEHNPHAIIECKRVSGSDAHLCREYVVEGIDRFRTAKYAGNHLTAFMVGYLIAGDAKSAVLRVNSYLDRKSRKGENLEPSVLLPTSWTWQSAHPRRKNRPITLHHAFLAFIVQ